MKRSTPDEDTATAPKRRVTERRAPDPKLYAGYGPGYKMPLDLSNKIAALVLPPEELTTEALAEAWRKAEHAAKDARSR